MKRIGVARIAALGCPVLAVGPARWAVALDTVPNYASALLSGMLITGFAVGSALASARGSVANRPGSARDGRAHPYRPLSTRLRPPRYC